MGTYSMPETIETPRLLLRLFAESDWRPLHQLFADEECVRYTIRRTLADWETWRTLAGYLGHWQLRGYGPYAAVEKSTGRMMGPIGLWYPGDWPEPEMKWALAREFWGKGFATEAARSVSVVAKKHLGWDRLISLILTDNVASKAVARRLGGVHEKTIPFRGESADIFAYRL